MSITYKDLRIFKIATELNSTIEYLVKSIPESEKYRLKDQILRSSRSISANIAEGYGKKVYQNELIKHLRYAIGSSDETQVHLNLLIEQKLVDKSLYLNLASDYKNLSVRILNFINTIQKN